MSIFVKCQLLYVVSLPFRYITYSLFVPSPQMVVMKDIPQQNNSSDCGMFSCKFAEYLSRRADITFDQADMPYFRRRMMWEIVKNNILHP